MDPRKPHDQCIRAQPGSVWFPGRFYEVLWYLPGEGSEHLACLPACLCRVLTLSFKDIEECAEGQGVNCLGPNRANSAEMVLETERIQTTHLFRLPISCST